MSRKTVILTEIIAPYRIPVFNVLARRAEVDLQVLFLAETDETLRQWRVHKDEICFPHNILPSWRWRAGRTSFLINREQMAVHAGDVNHAIGDRRRRHDCSACFEGPFHAF